MDSVNLDDPNNTTKITIETSAIFDEKDAGISEFLNEGISFDAVIKHR